MTQTWSGPVDWGTFDRAMGAVRLDRVHILDVGRRPAIVRTMQTYAAAVADSMQRVVDALGVRDQG